MNNARTVAKLVVLNYSRYKAEREGREPRMYRLNYSGLRSLFGFSHLIPESVLLELKDELAKLGFLLIRNDHSEFLIYDQVFQSSVVKLSARRVIDLADQDPEIIDAVFASEYKPSTWTAPKRDQSIPLSAHHEGE